MKRKSENEKRKLEKCKKNKEAKKEGRNAADGMVEIAVGMYLLVILMILAAVQLQVRLFGITSAQAEDALAASGLASAVADLKEYGISHMLVIASADNAYAVYKEALRQNLNLNGDGEVPNKDLISGAVKIENYSIYNVREDQVTIYSYGEDGECHQSVEENGRGRITAPDGTLIENTSVYSRIKFPVKGILGVTFQARKEKTVDIIRN